MDSAAQLLDELHTFRDSLYRCFERRAEALFELADALLTAAAGTVPSPVHLSLVPAHRRGWGSLYAALRCGRIEEGPLRELLARHASAGEASRAPVYAVDVSVWSRCDAEASPGRGYYYHPSRHSAGQPIVAGWAYQLVAGLSFERDSWVAPMDARRVRPEEDANEVAVEQVKDLLGRSSRRGAPPLFVFEAGYDPVKLQRGLEGQRAHVLVRLHSNRAFYADPEEVEKRPVGRPRRHGKKFALPDPETWPEPAHEHRCTSEDYGEVCVRAWPGLHPKTRRIAERYGCEKAPIVRGTVVLVEVGKLPRETRKPKKLWLWFSSEGEPDLDLLWRAYVRRFDLEHTIRFLKADARVDRAEGQAPRTGGQVDLARALSLRPTEDGTLVRGGPPSAVGAPAARAAADAMPDASGFRDAPGGGRHPGEGAETLREIAGTAQRTPLGPGEALPGAQESRLN